MIPLPNPFLQSEVEILPKVKLPLTPEEVEETDVVYRFFLELAGEDEEVDWKELKTLLDTTMSSGDQFVRAERQRRILNTKDPQWPQYSAEELATLKEMINLFYVAFAGFSKDICRSMVAMLDSDRSGRLGFSEFKFLWESIRNWKNAWIMYDIDKSGTFNGFELRQALNAAGYRMNNRILNILMHRYGNKSAEIHFDDFMMCAIKLKTMIDIFKDKDPTEMNTATFTMEEWLENTLYS